MRYVCACSMKKVIKELSGTVIELERWQVINNLDAVP
jgi:hypothetical protein